MGICPLDGEGIPKGGGELSAEQAIDALFADIATVFVKWLAQAIQTLLLNKAGAIKTALVNSAAQYDSDRYAIHQFFLNWHEINPAITLNGSSIFTINLADFCKVSPPKDIQAPSFDEFYGFLLGLDANTDQFMYKMARISYTNKWAALCKCKSELPPKPYPKPFSPNFPSCPNGTTPRSKPYGVYYSDQPIPETYQFIGGALKLWWGCNSYAKNVTFSPFAYYSDLLDGSPSGLYGCNSDQIKFPFTIARSDAEGNVSSIAYLMLLPLESISGGYQPDGLPPINTGLDGLPDLICDWNTDPTPEPTPTPKTDKDKFNCDIPNDCGVSETKEYEIAKPDYDPAYAELALDEVSLTLPSFDGSTITKTYNLLE